MMNNDDIRNAAMNELKQLMGMMANPQAMEMAGACRELFVLYKGFVEAGFTDKQAMQLIVGILQAGIANNGRKENEK